MNSTGCSTDVRALACVFFQVRTFNANASATWKHEETVDVQRNVVLADLIRLWHIGIEVILAVEDARLDGTVERDSDTHCQFHSLTVEHRQCSGKPKRHRVDVDVWFIAETVWRTTEQFCLCREFNMNFETNNHFPTTVEHLLGCSND